MAHLPDALVPVQGVEGGDQGLALADAVPCTHSTEALDMGDLGWWGRQSNGVTLALLRCRVCSSTGLHSIAGDPRVMCGRCSTRACKVACSWLCSTMRIPKGPLQSCAGPCLGAPCMAHHAHRCRKQCSAQSSLNQLGERGSGL